MPPGEQKTDMAERMKKNATKRSVQPWFNVPMKRSVSKAHKKPTMTRAKKATELTVVRASGVWLSECSSA